jgi:hypothetical protein
MSLKKIAIAASTALLLLGAGCEDMTALTAPSETDTNLTGTTDVTPVDTADGVPPLPASPTASTTPQVAPPPSPTKADAPSPATTSPNSADNELDIDTGAYNANGLDDK